MIGIWTMDKAFPSRLVSGSSIDGTDVCFCDILNGSEVRAAVFYEGRPRDVPFPVAQLEITLEDFDGDFFVWEGRTFVSERLRRAMALDPLAVRYFEVDASACAPKPRSKNFQIMELTTDGDFSDPDRSEYEVIRDPGTGVAIFNNALSIVMRAEFTPKYELFHDSFFHVHRLCTEALAVRVLMAGCIGLRFSDPTRMGAGAKKRYRTLRGIEEHVELDVENEVEITRVIQSIN